MNRHQAESNINTSFKLDIQSQVGGKNLDVDGQGVGVLEIRQFSWASYVYRALL